MCWEAMHVRPSMAESSQLLEINSSPCHIDWVTAKAAAKDGNDPQAVQR